MVNILYNDYETDFDKELHVIESENSINVGRALLTLETCLALQDLKYEEAELQCMRESGDMERLCVLYEEAENETKEKEKGAISKLFDAIANAFRRIKEFLFGKQLTEEELEAAKQDQSDMQVAKEDMDNANLIVKTWDTVKGFFSNAKNAESNEANIMKKIGVITGIAAAGAAGTMVAYKTGAVANVCDQLKEVCNTCSHKASELKNSEAQGVKGAFLNTIGNALNGVSKSVSAIAGALVKPLKTKRQKAGEALSKDNSDMSTAKGIQTKIKKLEKLRDASGDKPDKQKEYNQRIKDLYAKLADAKNSGGQLSAKPQEKPFDEEKKSLWDAVKAAKDAVTKETDPNKKADLNGVYVAAKEKYQNFLKQHSGSNGVKQESVEDFFDFELPDEFMESTADASDICNLIESII